jgi:hypothetical protein
MSHIHQKTHRKALSPHQAASVNDIGESALQHIEAALDEALMESFPASDPFAVSIDTIISGANRNRRPRREHQTTCGTESGPDT